MKDIIKKIASSLNNNHGVDSKDISVIEELLNVAFPQDYITLLKWSNGGEGYIGENYMSLWKVEDLPAFNKEYQIQKYLSEKFLGIGTDGEEKRKFKHQKRHLNRISVRFGRLDIRFWAFRF